MCFLSFLVIFLHRSTPYWVDWVIVLLFLVMGILLVKVFILSRRRISELKEALDNELPFREKLKAAHDHILQLNSKIMELRMELSAATNDITELHNLLEEHQINKKGMPDYSLFVSKLREGNVDFLNFLKTTHSSLTTHELDFCILLREGFDNNDISTIFGVSHQDIMSVKYRISKKLNLAASINISQYFKMLK